MHTNTLMWDEWIDRQREREMIPICQKKLWIQQAFYHLLRQMVGTYDSLELEFRLVSATDALLWVDERLVALALWTSSTSLPSRWSYDFGGKSLVIFAWFTGVSVRTVDGVSRFKVRSWLTRRAFPDFGGRRLFGVLVGGRSFGERLRKYRPVGRGIRLLCWPPFLAIAIWSKKTKSNKQNRKICTDESNFFN